MPDDKTDRGERDRERVNVTEPHEIAYWTKALNCTEAQLRDAVATVGMIASDVREHVEAARK